MNIQILRLKDNVTCIAGRNLYTRVVHSCVFGIIQTKIRRYEHEITADSFQTNQTKLIQKLPVKEGINLVPMPDLGREKRGLSHSLH